MMYDVIVVGAGASGLFAMANLKKGLRAICVEKNSSAGRKLLLTGGGRCNLTSSEDIKQMVNAYEPASFVRKILYGFSNKELIKWFEDRGVKTFKEGKKIFPRSNSAKTVLDCLLKEVEKREYSILYHHNVLKIERCEENLQLYVAQHLSRKDKSKPYEEFDKSELKVFKCRKLILATGGKCYASTGSDGKLLEEHFELSPFEPSLTPIYIKEELFKDLAGVDIPDVRLISSEKKEFFGDLLFAGRYLSGPVILNFSSSFKLEHEERATSVLKLDSDERAASVFKHESDERAASAFKHESDENSSSSLKFENDKSGENSSSSLKFESDGSDENTSTFLKQREPGSLEEEKAKAEKNRRFRIDYLPQCSHDELLAKLQPKDREKRFFKTIVFEELNLPKRFLEVLLTKNHLMELKASELSKKALRAFVEDLKSMELTISKKGNFNIAMSSIGGIPTDEINAKNMSLKADIRIKVLGEALDIGAFTGGYNLQFAFSSAFLAVNDIDN